MTDLVFYNNAVTTLAAPCSNVATTCTVATGSGALFTPGPTGAQYFPLTFSDAATGLVNEIVWVTDVTGDVLTITRAQEGTSAQNWSTGDNAAAFVTAGMLETIATEAAPTADKWTNARTIAMTGDVTWSVSVDGSTNATAAGTLAVSGVSAGTYGSSTAVAVVTVDAKGRVTTATTTAIASAPKWATARTLSFTGDATGSGSVDGSASVATALTLATVSSTTGLFGGVGKAVTVTTNAKGLVTSISDDSILQIFSGLSVNTAGGTATYTAGGSIVRMNGFLVCTATDNGYAVGDTVIAPLTNDTTTNRGVIYGWNGTSVFYGVGSGGISMIPKTGGSANSITLTKWTLTLIASRQ